MIFCVCACDQIKLTKTLHDYGIIMTLVDIIISNVLKTGATSLLTPVLIAKSKVTNNKHPHVQFPMLTSISPPPPTPVVASPVLPPAVPCAGCRSMSVFGGGRRSPGVGRGRTEGGRRAHRGQPPLLGVWPVPRPPPGQYTPPVRRVLRDGNVL